ncbi:MAG: response regulator transcription factor [Gemmatimonadota bacterium]|nr:response regulator transcription factor [Gemmatimonadota bacterium]
MNSALLRTVLTDDHALVRAGIRSLLEQTDGVAVVGEAATGNEALEVINRTRPDLVFADIAMQGMSGIELATALADRYPAVRVVILSMHVNAGYVERALRAGVAGYLVKDAAAAELDLVLAAVRAGDTYLSPAAAREVVTGYLAQGTDGNADGASHLTPRQTEVLALLADGLSTKQAATALGISVKTVETHRGAVMERLGIRDLPGLVRHAMREGLIAPPG